MSITEKNPLCKDSLKLLGDFWTMMIIDVLADGPLRFRDLEQQIDGVNSATLTNRLKNLQSVGLLVRKENSRADVAYELTDLGKHALPILDAINNFSEYGRQLHTGR